MPITTTAETTLCQSSQLALNAGNPYGNLPALALQKPIRITPIDRYDTSSLSSDEMRINSVKAEQYSELETTADPAFVRSFHVDLRDHDEVFFSTYPSPVWIIFTSVSLPLEAGGINIQTVPDYEVIPPCPGHDAQIDPLRHLIDPRGFLTVEQCDILRANYPGSIGVRLYRVGILCVLYRDKSEIEEVLKRAPDLISEFGNLGVALQLAGIEPSAGPGPTVSTGSGLTTSPDQTVPASACLGLKLRFQGEEVMTAPTHAFVKTRTFYRSDKIRARYYDLKEKVKQSSLAKRLVSSIPAVFYSRVEENTAVGTKVWLVKPNRILGTVAKMFDGPINPNSYYPSGFRHDLCLISNHEEGLPELSSPPGYPTIKGWTNYDLVVAGCPVYVVRQVSNGAWNDISGRVVKEDDQKALIVASEYLWEQRARGIGVTLMWRSRPLISPVLGYSGSALCAGKVTDKASTVICFQSYEIMSKTKGSHGGDKDCVNFAKAGFLLPACIRESEILMTRTAATTAPSTFPLTRRRTPISNAGFNREAFSGLD